MQGQIIDFNADGNVGIISAADGGRYNFSSAEWRGRSAPTVGTTVDFAAEDGQARSIYAVAAPQRTRSSDHTKIVAAVLAVFLGTFGVHKFYLGKHAAGGIMLFAALFGWILLFIPTLIVSVIAFIEFIIYLVTSDEDFEERYVRGNKSWF